MKSLLLTGSAGVRPFWGPVRGSGEPSISSASSPTGKDDFALVRFCQVAEDTPRFGVADDGAWGHPAAEILSARARPVLAHSVAATLCPRVLLVALVQESR